MEITLKQAYDIFIADRETSCADETISYYKENLTVNCLHRLFAD